MMTTIRFAGILLVAAFSCTKLEQPSAVLPDEIMQLTSRKTAIKNNGEETVDVLVRLPKEAGNIDVVFSATGGRFTYSNDKSVKQMADSVAGSYRFARVVLQSDSSQGPKYVSAETAMTRRRILINFFK